MVEEMLFMFWLGGKHAVLNIENWQLHELDKMASFQASA